MTRGEADRLFVACELPAAALAALAGWQARCLGAKPELRINHALHLTLAFLGDVPRARTAEVVAALETVRFAELPLAVAGVLFLPERGRRRVVALALDDRSGGLAQLQADVARALADSGLFTPHRRAWLPHVTLARFRRPGQPFPLQNVTIPEFCAVRMVLYSSLLERTGAVHTPVAVFPAS
ncbi:MAG: RNA 2',3'-cyclic phosphodiesterase [Thermoleophilia bacterium]